MKDLLLSCDWGTSSFRLRLVDVSSHEIIGEVLSDEGIAGVYNQWKACCGNDDIGRVNFYLKQLHKHIDALSNNVSVSLNEIPVVISGMAGSSIGITDLPYASLPFSLDGSDTVVQKLGAGENLQQNVWLISGVSNRLDVMRGEEVQMIGLAATNTEVYSAEEITCILPGTHSKHIKVQNGRITDFQTYMTGEIFQVMAHHTILKDSISAYNGKAVLNKVDRDAFCEGVQQSVTSNLLHTLFSVRINRLFEYLTKEQNYFYLSGLVIGTELRSLQNSSGRIMLCSGSNVYHLYQHALAELELLHRTSFTEPEIMDKTAVEGQLKVLQNQDSRSLKFTE